MVRYKNLNLNLELKFKIWIYIFLLKAFALGSSQLELRRYGDSDVGDIVMLWLKDGDRFQMLVTKRYVGDIPIGHQHHYMSECDVGDKIITLSLPARPQTQIQSEESQSTGRYELGPFSSSFTL